MFRILIGSFDLMSLKAVSPYWGPVFFVSYIITAVYLLLNMFVAIIYLAYAKAAEEIKKKTPELMFDDFIRAKYGRLADKLKKRNRMLDAEQVLNTGEALSKMELDFNLWRREMKVFFIFH